MILRFGVAFGPRFRPFGVELLARLAASRFNR